MQVSHHEGASPTYMQDPHMQVCHHEWASPAGPTVHMQVSHHEPLMLRKTMSS
jgi:hypothetical protein